MIILFLVGLFVQWRLKSKFTEYSQIALSSGLTGAEVAQKMLYENGVTDVRVLSVDGQLTDHYNPQDKTVNLSPDVYHGRSVMAAAVAAHECGHAVQHKVAYGPLQFRSAIVPFVSVSSRYMQWILLAGILMINSTLLPLQIGVALFAVTTLFTFITLPVEFDASKRALAWIESRGVVSPREYDVAKDGLKWAAMTYVVAALSSLATLLYYVSILNGRSRD
ncbi:zinc metallopeptidase [Fibrella forsythiae]|uniref:Zinc metallopeptidase n=1 Tax=Fibrella forsythiae TaxID=2817061 RepID=A0ABS3JH10_9BACT|nr:zinc metallopeptidase [Fibrella forsythiae]MBO0949298.1 zinc metallopeptidase [Fibrella forsythiae]